MAEQTSVAEKRGDKREARPLHHRTLDFAFCAAFGYVCWIAIADVAIGLGARPALALLVPFVALASWLTMDFFSGLIHWLADTYFSRTTPFIGPKFVTPFREHHEDPQAISRHDFFEANGDNCLMASLMVLPTHALVPSAHEAWATLLSLYVLLIGVAAFLTSMIHGWAHAAEPPRIVGLLQRAGLVLHPDHHALHHRAPHKSNYCITSGWLNALIDRTSFFRRLERLLHRAGLEPSDEA